MKTKINKVNKKNKTIPILSITFCILGSLAIITSKDINIQILGAIVALYGLTDWKLKNIIYELNEIKRRLE